MIFLDSTNIFHIRNPEINKLMELATQNIDFIW